MRLHTIMTPLILAAVIMHLGGCGIVAVVKSTETRTQSTAHVAGTQLVVQGVNGTIHVITEPDREDVHVTAEITAGGLTREDADDRLQKTLLIVTRDTNRTLTIDTEFPTPSSNGDNADLTIRIPAASQLRVNTVNGTITVEGMHAAMTLTTTNGRVNVVDSQGDAGVTTVNGRIEFEKHHGKVTAHSTNGRITLTELTGSADVNTVNGRVTVTLTDEAVGPLTLRTTNGRIEAQLGKGFAGEVEARTGNGSVSVADEAGILVSQFTERRFSKLTFANEGPASSLRTGNGSITVSTQ